MNGPPLDAALLSSAEVATLKKLLSQRLEANVPKDMPERMRKALLKKQQEQLEVEIEYCGG